MRRYRTTCRDLEAFSVGYGSTSVSELCLLRDGSIRALEHVLSKERWPRLTGGSAVGMLPLPVSELCIPKKLCLSSEIWDVSLRQIIHLTTRDSACYHWRLYPSRVDWGHCVYYDQLWEESLGQICHVAAGDSAVWSVLTLAVSWWVGNCVYQESSGVMYCVCAVYAVL